MDPILQGNQAQSVKLVELVATFVIFMDNENTHGQKERKIKGPLLNIDFTLRSVKSFAIRF